MVAFTLSCVALFLWMWLSFGGPIPIKPKGYRFEASFDEAALLVEQADVRIAGLDVGKVTDKHLDRRPGARSPRSSWTTPTRRSPRTRARRCCQKALLGETYIELSPGTGSGPNLQDGDRLPARAVTESVQIDEIVRVFDKPTRTAFQGWIRELARAIEKGRGEHLNDALGNLPEFVASGRDVLQVLDSEEPALHRLVRNSGRTLDAVNERRGQLRGLVVNANDFFGALASRNEALAETVFILPTFLNESRLTLNRLRGFARNTRPLVRDLQPVATDLRPTLHDLGRLAPDLKALFRNLDPLINESKRNLPPAARFIRGAEPLLEALHVYLPELNPVLSFLNYQQEQVADFIMTGSGTLNATLPPRPGEGPRHYLRGYTAINSRSVGIARTRPDYERANSVSGAQLPEAEQAARDRRVVRLQAHRQGRGARAREQPAALLCAAQPALGQQAVPAAGQGRRPAAAAAQGHRGHQAQHALSAPRRLAVVGAGPSGLAALRALGAAGIDAVAFERRPLIGGVWSLDHEQPTAAYRSLHLITSKARTEFGELPMPDGTPDYPSRDEVARYLEDYARRFDLLDRIRLGNGVREARRLPGGGWEVTPDEGEPERFDGLVAANGHNEDARWPEPPYPGEFDGRQLHALDYREPEEFRDQSVLVVGMGNSAMDIATDVSHFASRTLLSVRHGSWVIPKRLLGQPADQVIRPWAAVHVPWRLRQPLAQRLMRLTVGPPDRYGLPGAGARAVRATIRRSPTRCSAR